MKTIARRLLGHGYPLLVVIIGWVLFRAPNLEYALGCLRIMFGLAAVPLLFSECTRIIWVLRNWRRIRNPDSGRAQRE